MDLVISFDRCSTTPLYQQLVEELRNAVLGGRLKPNQKLPSSRLLAKSLGLSRATVTQSYGQLLSEGYFKARHGSGTYVCAQLPDDCLDAAPLASEASTPSEPTSSLSRFGAHLLEVEPMSLSEPEAEISFRYGNPAAEVFPIALWRRLLNRHCQKSPALLNYADAAGYLPLRAAIAEYLGRARAVRCRPEQVIIVNGSQQALDLIARLTIDVGDEVAIEDPGYLGARCCFRGQGANLQAIPVDAEGINVDALRQHQQPFKLLYITPSHQFPTGALLSLSRRLALLQWAQQTGTLIVEDDYDSQYRYGDSPIPALQGLDRRNAVIYVGTFSKILFPSLRIGYLVAPLEWIPLISRAKWLSDRHSPLLEQYALTECLVEGHFERHIRRMRHLYNQRRQTLVESLKRHLGSRVTILGDNAGIHLLAKIDAPWPDDVVIQKAKHLGVGLISAQGYYLTTPKTGEFIFGYAQLNEAQIEQGIQRFSQVLNS